MIFRVWFADVLVPVAAPLPERRWEQRLGPVPDPVTLQRLMLDLGYSPADAWDWPGADITRSGAFWRLRYERS